MSKIGFYNFAIVIIFIDDEWVPCQITVRLCKAPNTFGTTLTR